MADFTWAYHTVSTKYPESGSRMTLGNSYQYASEPVGPDQRMFVLSFESMRYFLTAGAVDATVQAVVNMAALDAHYQANRLWKTFVYPHPVYGNVNVKYAKPLEIPKGIKGGQGATEGFTVELIEQP